GGVVELPVEVALAGVVRAGVAAAHGDHDVGGLDGVAGERLGKLGGEVDPELGHDRDHGRVDSIGWFGAGGAHGDGSLGVVGEKRGGHLRAAGVVHAHEQDLGAGGHTDSFGVSVSVKVLAGLGAGNRQSTAARARAAP